jgi:hypothetical protein
MKIHFNVKLQAIQIARFPAQPQQQEQQQLAPNQNASLPLETLAPEVREVRLPSHLYCLPAYFLSCPLSFSYGIYFSGFFFCLSFFRFACFYSLLFFVLFSYS